MNTYSILGMGPYPVSMGTVPQLWLNPRRRHSHEPACAAVTEAGSSSCRRIDAGLAKIEVLGALVTLE